MEKKPVYKQQIITELKKVGSESLNGNEQAYRIIYLEKTKKFMDKVRIYFYDRPPDKCNPRSLSFLNPEDLLNFIKEQCHSYLLLKEQRVKPELQMPLDQYRTEIMLPDLLKSIREEQLNKWKNNNNGKPTS